ncbi:MAG: fructose-6-phosphate aldolase [Candidatus Izimaplasma sp.]|nr:fructose-6-phosphate aldolase [Candidatus Izimaplasma bacterium]
MEYLLDTANKQLIKDILNYYPIDGITTNPTIMTKEPGAYLDILSDLDTLLDGRQFHIQLTSITFPDMVEEAKRLNDIIQSELYLKIPVSHEGIKAIYKLSKQGFKVTATAVTNLNQGIMAAKAGASYLAFYVNRTASTGINGNDVINEIISIFKRDGYQTKIIGASYKSIYQINKSILNGCKSVTVPPTLFKELMETTVTKESIEQFTNNFKDRFKQIGPSIYKE